MIHKKVFDKQINESNMYKVQISKNRRINNPMLNQPNNMRSASVKDVSDINQKKTQDDFQTHYSKLLLIKREDEDSRSSPKNSRGSHKRPINNSSSELLKPLTTA